MSAYSQTVQEHFRQPRNAGTWPDANAIGQASNPVCGDTLVLYLRVEDDIIVGARFLAQGCPAAIAAGSMTTVLLTGRSRVQAGRLTNTEVAEALGGLPADKMHCSVLAEEAVAAALAPPRSV